MTDDPAVTYGYQVNDIVTGFECPGLLDNFDLLVSVAGRVGERAANELENCGSVIGERRANHE